jgi:electron transfer flavoprotein alpha subunit
MLSKILVVLDRQEGAVTAASLEAVALAQELSRACGAKTVAVTLGVDESAALAAQSVQLDELWAVVDPLLAEYSPGPYSAALLPFLDDVGPDLVLFPHSYQNMDLVPRLAARLRVPLVTDCISCREDERGLLFTRQMFRSKLNADVRLAGAKPGLATLQRGAFSTERLVSGQSAVRVHAAGLSPAVRQWTIEQQLEAPRRKVDLSKAEVVVGVGRGVRSKEVLAQIEELAVLLGAEIGASRPVVDNDWLERDRQIGSSGQTVSPRLYLALGISGAIQHVVGIRNSGCIVAVNSDPHAPIFNIANFGIVGDVAEVVPVMIRQLKESSGR